jgi:acetyl esterase/lipase
VVTIIRDPVARRCLSALILFMVAACGSPQAAVTTQPSAAVLPATTQQGSETPGPVTEEYLEGVEADLYLANGVERAPVAVLIPGGGWVEADRSGLGPLAADLAAMGIMVVNATYRPARDGGRFPQMVQDVVCAARFAAAYSRESGVEPTGVVIVGHSAGAHLAALAALAGNDFESQCPHPRTQIDGLVGLAGPYDISRIAEVAEPFFGATPQEDPIAWREGNPMSHVDRRRNVPVLLLHGDTDSLVPVSFTDGFAAALEQAGHDVEVNIISGADHFSIFAPEVVADLIGEWILTKEGEGL